MVERSARALAAFSCTTAACLALGALAPAMAQDVGPPDRGLDRGPGIGIDLDRRGVGVDNRDLDRRPDRARGYEWGPRERGTRFGRDRYQGGQDRLTSDGRVGGQYVIHADDDPDEVLFKKLGNLGLDVRGLELDYADGVLTVDGLVEAPGDEDLILQQAYLLEDVEEVRNQLLLRSPFRSDRRIEMAAEAAIQADPTLNLAGLDVEVRDQVAYVSGTVPTPVEAELLVSTLRGVRGVAQVVPRLRAARGVSEVSDETLEAYLWRRVLSTPRLSPNDLRDVRLEVDDRVVQVAGVVDDVDVRTYLQDALVAQGVRGVDASDLYLEGSTLPAHVRRLLEQTRPGFERRGYRADRSGDLTLEAGARRAPARDAQRGDARREQRAEDAQGEPARQDAQTEPDARPTQDQTRRTEQEMLERVALQQEEEEAARARGRAGAMDVGGQAPGELAGEQRDEPPTADRATPDRAADQQPEQRTARRRRARTPRAGGEQAQGAVELDPEQRQAVRRSLNRRLQDLADRRERARTALDAWVETDPGALGADQPEPTTLRAGMIRAHRMPLTTAPPSEPAPPLQPILAEQAIGFVIEDHLARDPFLAPYALEVDYADGVAVLSGVVDSLRVRQAAERVALEDQRVFQVVNDIQLAGLPGELLPESVRARVSRNILDHPTLGRRDIVVLFAGDEVRLSGTVHGEREALLAEQIVQDTPGVARVVNELAIVE